MTGSERQTASGRAAHQTLPMSRRDCSRRHIIETMTRRVIHNEIGAAVVVWGSEDGGAEQNTLGKLPVACDPTTVIGVLVFSNGTAEELRPAAFGEVVRLCAPHDEAVRHGAELYEFDERSPTLEEWMQQHQTVEELSAELLKARKDSRALMTWRGRREQRKAWARRQAESQRQLHERAKRHPGGVAQFNFDEGQKRVAGNAQFDADRQRWARERERQRERARRAEEAADADVEAFRAWNPQRAGGPLDLDDADGA